MYLVCGEALFDFFSENEASGQASTVNFKAIAGGSPHYSFRGEGCADRQLTLAHLPELNEQVRGLYWLESESGF